MPVHSRGAWTWLGPLCDPEGAWNEDTPRRCGKTSAVYNKSSNIMFGKDATLRNRMEYVWAMVGAVMLANCGSRARSDAQLGQVYNTMMVMMRRQESLYST